MSKIGTVVINKKFDKESFEILFRALKVQLPIQQEWFKIGFRKKKTSIKEANAVYFSLRGIIFLKARRNSISFNTHPLTEEEDALIQLALQKSKFIPKPNFFWPISLTLLFFVLFFSLIVVSLARRFPTPTDLEIATYCGVTLILILFGMIMKYLFLPQTCQKKSIRLMTYTILWLSLCLTYPVSFLYFGLVFALDAKYLYDMLEQLK